MLYVRNLTQECTEEKLKEAFQEHGVVQRVKKMKDYAFVHFEEREDAVRAMDAMQGRTVHGATLEISLAKPPSDRKKKEELLKARERRLMQTHFGNPRIGVVPPVVPQPFRGVRPPMRGGSVPGASAAAPLAYARGKKHSPVKAPVDKENGPRKTGPDETRFARRSKRRSPGHYQRRFFRTFPSTPQTNFNPRVYDY